MISTLATAGSTLRASRMHCPQTRVMTQAKLGAIARGVKSCGCSVKLVDFLGGQRSRRDADLGTTSGGHVMTTTAFFVTLSTVCDACCTCSGQVWVTSTHPGCLAATGQVPLRVGEDVATLTPHRPGSADFPHPVLHGRASLTAV